MAKICANCLNLAPTLTRGMCGPCAADSERTRRPSSHERYGRDYQANRDLLLADSPPCVWCGELATTADHYPVARVDGGSHDLSNLVPACARCNSAHVNRKG